MGAIARTRRTLGKTETKRGKARVLWHSFYEAELCQSCGRRYDYFLWWCESNERWHEVTGRGAGGLCCPRCFDRKARAMGYHFFWTPRLREETRFEPEYEGGERNMRSVKPDRWGALKGSVMGPHRKQALRALFS